MTGITGTASAAPAPQRRRVTVRGAVQGVGFRPFVHALAGELGLSGQVANTVDGVVVEVEGTASALSSFCERVARDAPPLAVVESVAQEPVAALGGAGFVIAASRPGSTVRTLVAPDAATCHRCLAELSDPVDRRHRHPFISCTHCGPRFTIVTGLPYDRPQTTMAGFPLCPRCRDEYHDPADRRFHAQPIACHDCGPKLALVAPGAEPAADPVAAARRLLAEGAVVAVKGLGGYHLACDAANSESVRLLRRRKGRGDKPFALMVRDLATAERLVAVDAVARDLLTDGRRPIVLLRRKDDTGQDVAAEVAPGSADLGVMLPYTPVHHLLFGLPGDPPGPHVLVMTSGNLSGEPIVTDDGEALRRLTGLADAWLTHDRPIHVPCDDSVVRVTDGQELPLRRSRGYAPLPVRLPLPVPPTLAVGGDLKNTFCLGEGHRAWLSAHVGDMDGLATLAAFGSAERQLEEITGVRPALLAADRHPGYRSGQWAERAAAGRPVRRVQHHHAHIASVLAEHGADGATPVIGIAFDGTGYGEDGAVWGGEVLLADYDGFQRFAHLAYVPLPGGDASIRRPYRMALSHLRAAGLDWADDLPCTGVCPPPERRTLTVQLERGLHCVPTSSMGRLFDAVSSLIGICHYARYEAQAALELEAAAVRAEGDTGGYAFGLHTGDTLTADPGPVLSAAVADMRSGVPVELIAARFHHAIADLVRRLCAAARERHGLKTVALSGGVFANALLSGACADGLRADGFTVLRHRLVPPGDGGLALGQLMVASRAATAADGGRPPHKRPNHDRTHSEEN